MPGETIKRVAPAALLPGIEAQVDAVAMESRQGGVKVDIVSATDAQQLLIE